MFGFQGVHALLCSKGLDSRDACLDKIHLKSDLPLQTFIDCSLRDLASFQKHTQNGIFWTTMGALGISIPSDAALASFSSCLCSIRSRW